jgi:hypothetical protein
MDLGVLAKGKLDEGTLANYMRLVRLHFVDSQCSSIDANIALEGRHHPHPSHSKRDV